MTTNVITGMFSSGSSTDCLQKVLGKNLNNTKHTNKCLKYGLLTDLDKP